MAAKNAGKRKKNSEGNTPAHAPHTEDRTLNIKAHTEEHLQETRGNR